MKDWDLSSKLPEGQLKHYSCLRTEKHILFMTLGAKTVVHQAPIVQKVNYDTHWISIFTEDSAIVFFRYTYSLDKYLPGGQRYPTFEQLEPEILATTMWQHLHSSLYRLSLKVINTRVFVCMYCL